MTFKEYLIQVDPRKLPRVVIRQEDIYTSWRVRRGKAILLDIHDEIFQYYVPNNSIILWTTDEDGNKKKPSCFVLDK